MIAAIRTGLKNSFLARLASREAKWGKPAKILNGYPPAYSEDFLARDNELGVFMLLTAGDDFFEARFGLLVTQQD
jgi:hypothetical protein